MNYGLTCILTLYIFSSNIIVTMVPIKTDLIDKSLLTPAECIWLNEYHCQVREALLPLMEEIFPDTVNYLIKETEPISL